MPTVTGLKVDGAKYNFKSYSISEGVLSLVDHRTDDYILVMSFAPGTWKKVELTYDEDK